MTRSIRLLFASIAVVSSVSWAAPAFAQDPTPGGVKVDNRARAQQLFDSALTDAEAGNFAAACPKFLASQEADPKTSTLLNLGACYEKNGQTASAWGAFREAETLARKIGRADWETNARAKAEELEPKLVRLTVQVPEASKVSGLTVTRDGNRLSAGEWGVAIPVDPGDHVVAATAAGRTPWEKRVTVRDASSAISVPPLEVLPEAPATVTTTPLPPGADAPPPSWWTPLRTAGAVSIGVGAAAVLGGIVMGAIANGNYEDARSQCSNGSSGCPGDAVRDANGAYSLAGGATAVFVVGTVIAATGTALILFSPGPNMQVRASASSIALGGSF